MLKTFEMLNEDSCFNKAGNDEQIFVLLARDSSAPVAIRAWCADRVLSGKNNRNDNQIIEALQCANDMESSRLRLRRKR